MRFINFNSILICIYQENCAIYLIILESRKIYNKEFIIYREEFIIYIYKLIM